MSARADRILALVGAHLRAWPLLRAREGRKIVLPASLLILLVLFGQQLYGHGDRGAAASIRRCATRRARAT